MISSPARALWTIVVSSVTGGGLGAAIGALLALSIPDYYRGVFGDGLRAAFNPLHVGLGLGFTQGLILGAFVGLGVVGIFVWRDVQLARWGRPNAPIPRDSANPTPPASA